MGAILVGGALEVADRAFLRGVVVLVTVAGETQCPGRHQLRHRGRRVAGIALDVRLHRSLVRRDDLGGTVTSGAVPIRLVMLLVATDA